MRDTPGIFADRRDAGRRLAGRLEGHRARNDAIVLGLPRGGVVVGFEVAKTLDLPLDVLLVRKLGVPGREELAMGAIGSGGLRVMNDDVVKALGLTAGEIEAAVAREQRELERRERLYRGRPASPEVAGPPAVAGKVVIVVDDGLATGASMRAAVLVLKRLAPAQVVIAVPTAPPSTCADLGSEVDEMVCLITPEPFYGVGMWYVEFAQTSDEEVIELLEQAKAFGRRPAEQ